MKIQTFVVLFALSSAPAAFAGSWNYGCVGKLSDGRRVLFNRSSMVVVAEALASGRIDRTAEGDDTLEAFLAKDVNSGFRDKMEFEHRWGNEAPETITLVERESKSVSRSARTEECGRPERIRDVSREIFQKTYEFQRDREKTESVRMSCYENTITACG